MRTDIDDDHAGDLPPWLQPPDAGRAAIERIEAAAREATSARGHRLPGGIVTSIRVQAPATVQKVFSIGANGRLTKTAAATIREGVAMSLRATGLRELAGVIEDLSDQPDQCLVLGGFLDAPAAAPFDLVSRRRLQAMLPRLRADALFGVHDGPHGPVAARLAAGIDQSGFLLMDADCWPGMPPAWAAMTLAERLMFLSAVVPGLATCERVESRSSSARVVAPGGQPGAASHGWIQVSDPDLIPSLHRHVARATVSRGLARQMDRKARDGSGRVTGREWRTVFDLAVWHAGRLVFVAPPDVEAAPGYSVADAGVRLVNEGAGLLDLEWLRQDRPALVGGCRLDATESVPMGWADEAPPHDGPERQPNRAGGGAACRTLPDLASVDVGGRNAAMFNLARLKAYAWADQHGSAEVPFGLVLGWCREAVAGMECDTAETSAQAVATARSITDWMPLHYEPGVGVRSAPKTEAEILAARRAGQAKGAATKRAKSIFLLRKAIAEIEAEGRQPTQREAAGRAMMCERTARKRWAESGHCARRTPAFQSHHHIEGVGTPSPPDAVPLSRPSARPEPVPHGGDDVPAAADKIVSRCLRRATAAAGRGAAAGAAAGGVGAAGPPEVADRAPRPPDRGRAPDELAAGLHRGWQVHMARLRVVGSSP